MESRRRSGDSVKREKERVAGYDERRNGIFMHVFTHIPVFKSL